MQQRRAPEKPRPLWQRVFIAYGDRVAKLPTICPPMGPTIVAVIAIPLFAGLGITPWLVLVGAIVCALWPQWDSCLFGLWDFLAMCAVIGVGAVALVKQVAA
jgi:hypothetical protein